MLSVEFTAHSASTRSWLRLSSTAPTLHGTMAGLAGAASRAELCRTLGIKPLSVTPRR